VTRVKNKSLFILYFLCFMLKQLDKIEEELIDKIYRLSIEKFNGNNSQFARKSNCSEASIRRIFKREQRMTFNMLLKLCYGLEIDIKYLLEDINTKFSDIN
jgi:transcriptional regulator with XRE-family HTH domain